MDEPVRIHGPMPDDAMTRARAMVEGMSPEQVQAILAALPRDTPRSRRRRRMARIVREPIETGEVHDG